MKQDYFVAADGVTIGYRTSTGVFTPVCKATNQLVAVRLLAAMQRDGYNIHTQPIDGGY